MRKHIYYSVLRRKAVLAHTLTWMNLEDVMLSGIKETKGQMLCDFTCIMNLIVVEFRGRKWKMAAGGWQDRRVAGLEGTGPRFGKMKKSWGWVDIMVIQ